MVGKQNLWYLSFVVLMFYGSSTQFRSFQARPFNLATLFLGIKFNWKVQGVPQSQITANPRLIGVEKKDKTKMYNTNKQMHKKDTDQLPLPQERGSQCWKEWRNTRTKSTRRLQNMKRSAVLTTKPHRIRTAPGPPPKNGQWHKLPGG